MNINCKYIFIYNISWMLIVSLLLLRSIYLFPCQIKNEKHNIFVIFCAIEYTYDKHFPM